MNDGRKERGYDKTKSKMRGEFEGSHLKRARQHFLFISSLVKKLQLNYKNTEIKLFLQARN